MTIERGCRELLLAVVRDSTTAGDLRSLADSVSDWDQLVDLALQHQVLPMLFARLADLEPAMPTGVLDRIRREYDRIVLHNLANAAELIAVLQTFEREGIRAMPFKGVVLAASAYGDLLKRPGGDLDLLIRPEDLARASELILQRGYELKLPAPLGDIPELSKPYEHTFVRRSDGRVLELRWKLDLVSNRHRRNLGVEWVWAHRRTVMLSGAEVPDIIPEILLLILCMHGSKHYWSRLGWVCDVGKLIESSPDLNWMRIFEEARRQRLRRSLALGVLLGVRMIGVAIPFEVLHRIEEDKTAVRLADHFANNLLKTPGKPPPGRIPYGIHLLDFRDRVQLFLSVSFLQPSDRDREVFDLPRWLFPLYYLLRPLRLMRDRSAR